MTSGPFIENASPRDWRDLSLHDGGRSLIEASAGTGKTWTISVLYLRLLLEQQLTPKQIVVTTFTDAAAQELRERIRNRLLWAARNARTACEARDRIPADNAGLKSDEQWLQARWLDASCATLDATRITADLHRLRLAEAELDLAPIGTLHSLCRRVLTDFPFESGGTFDLGDMLSTESLIEGCADDLWRRLYQGTDIPGADAYVPPTLRALRERLRVYLSPGVAVRVPDEQALHAVHTEETAKRIDAFAAHTAMYVLTPTGRPSQRLKNALQSLARWVRDPTHQVSDNHRGTLADPEAEIQPRFWVTLRDGPDLALVDSVLAALEAQTSLPEARAWLAWVESARMANQQRLAAAGQVTFDELIERVHRALPEGGSALADRLFAAWPAAMVDEFQDTDALQYAILDRIYRDRDGGSSRPSPASGALGLLPGVPRGRLVMIGDPKQAIYRFRGGDIDAYLDAGATATSTLALDTNFRSSRKLVAALNEFYARAGESLSRDPQYRIRYQAVQASGVRDEEPYEISGFACERPLAFHYWSADDVPDDAASRARFALEACANHIVALLQPGMHSIGGKPLRPGDIAVLLPTNPHILQLRGLLRERNVPCVSSARSSVFESASARELQIMLYAALHPRDARAVRAALATQLGGRTYDELRELADDPERWQREADAFEQLDRIWRARGVLAAVQQLTSAAAPRLFARGDGERAATDLRHLGELLQARSERLSGREELLAWLTDQRNDKGTEDGEAADEMQLRIEADSERVRLLTLHSSKGLEFPLVLLPLMWANKHMSRDIVPILHDAQTRQRIAAFGDAARARYRREGQDERFRLLYVALTRARHACHVYALPPDRPLQGGSKSADSDPNRAPLDTMIERLLQQPDGADSMRHVQWSTIGWPWQFTKYQVIQSGAPTAPQVLSEPPTPPFEFRYSFSALAHGAGMAVVEGGAAADEEEDASATATQLEGAAPVVIVDAFCEPEHAQLAWLAPVAGPDFGNALHAIFEHRSIGRPMREQHALVRRCLRDEGVGLRGIALDDMVPHLAERVQVALDTRLLPDSDPSLTLGALPATALRAEMEFDFVLDAVSLRRLRDVCDFVPGSSVQTLRGTMNGKIDLVFEHDGRFHVLDYKSNRLGQGTRLSDYAPEQLDAVMNTAAYRFQALLYTVAVDRYLRQRVAQYRRQDHLGETIYLFVRAVGIAPNIVPRAGIWTQRFDDKLLEAVDGVLAGRTRNAA